MTVSVGWMRRKLPESSGIGLREGLRALGASAFALFVVIALGAAGRAALNVRTSAEGAIVTVGLQLPTSDAWTERLSDPSSWRGGRYIGDIRGRRPAYRGDWRAEPEYEEERPPEQTGFGSGTYRTVCVRLCDGFFFPISFATTPERFALDAAQCSARCTSSARLYVYPNPGGEPEQMMDLNGEPYTALKSAFLFRTNYDAACTCKPQLWSQEALARHRAYADAQKNAKTRTVARTIRPARTVEQQRAEAPSDSSNGGVRERPSGAMLLGADRERPTPRATQRAEQAPSARNRHGGAYGRRSDWHSRAFGGY